MNTLEPVKFERHSVILSAIVLLMIGMAFGSSIEREGVRQAQRERQTLQQVVDSLEYIVDSLQEISAMTPSADIDRFLIHESGHSRFSFGNEHVYSKCTFGHVSEGLEPCKGNPEEWRRQDRFAQDTLAIAIQGVLYPGMAPIWFPDMVRHFAWSEYLGIYKRPVCNPFSTVGIEDSCHGTFGSTWPDRK